MTFVRFISVCLWFFHGRWRSAVSPSLLMARPLAAASVPCRPSRSASRMPRAGIANRRQRMQGRIIIHFPPRGQRHWPRHWPRRADKIRAESDL